MTNDDEIMRECLKCLNDVKSFTSAAAISAASASASNESSSAAAISAASSTAAAASASDYSSVAAASAVEATASAAAAAASASDSIISHAASAAAVDDAMNVLCSINQTDSVAFNAAASRFVELYIDSSASSSDEREIRNVGVVKGMRGGKTKN